MGLDSQAALRARQLIFDSTAISGTLPLAQIPQSPEECILIEPSIQPIEPSLAKSKEKEQWDIRHLLPRLSAILIAVITMVFIVMLTPRIREFQQYGYPGVFLVNLIGSASILLPVPSLAITFSMGSILNWLLVGLFSGIGSALGELTGYLAGYGGGAIIENRKLYNRMCYYMEHHGMLTIFVLSLVPNPIVDLAGIASGASRYPIYKFMAAALLGKTIKCLIFAWAGAHSITWLLNWT